MYYLNIQIANVYWQIGGNMNHYALSETEMEIMEVLWKTNRPMPSRELLEHFNKVEGKDWKKQTLNTFFIRMIQKGALRSERKDTYCLYSPVYKRDEYEQMRAQNMLNSLYGGKLSNFIAALSGGKKISKEEANELRKMLD